MNTIVQYTPQTTSTQGRRIGLTFLKLTKKMWGLDSLSEESCAHESLMKTVENSVFAVACNPKPPGRKGEVGGSPKKLLIRLNTALFILHMHPYTKFYLKKLFFLAILLRKFIYTASATTKREEW